MLQTHACTVNANSCTTNTNVVAKSVIPENSAIAVRSSESTGFIEIISRASIDSIRTSVIPGNTATAVRTLESVAFI